MTGSLSKRTVLRTGYGAMILVLVLSAVEAYRIQLSVSEQHLGIYRHYVEQDAALATLRRNLWQAGTDIRDFFIRTTPQQAAALRVQLHASKRTMRLISFCGPPTSSHGSHTLYEWPIFDLL